jgi:septal ring factor EnvC (AmiA/AmiB activator)
MRGQTELDALGDAAKGTPGRGREVRASLQLVYEALERGKLSALNAGLEAGRLNEPAGKIVLQLAGDLRALIAGALEALEAHTTLLGESDRERERWLDGVLSTRETLARVVGDLGGLSQHRQELRSALGALERAVEPVLGADPQTARALAELGEQSRAIAANIAALAGKPGAPGEERLRQALAPLLDALAPKRESGA